MQTNPNPYLSSNHESVDLKLYKKARNMFNLIRRISGSVLPRNWSEDATPQIGRKRRRSEDEREDTPLSKKPKGVEDTVPEEGENGASSSRGASPAEVATPGNEAVEVKEVTKGVEGVELEGKKKAGDEKSPAKEKYATPPPDEKEAQKKQDAPGSPMKVVVEKSTDAGASVVPTPSTDVPAPVPSRPRAKKSTTAPPKKTSQQAPASPPRKKKPLPNRKNAASKAAVVAADTKEKSDVLVSAIANSTSGKEDVAV